jgi:hypothetical protein
MENLEYATEEDLEIFHKLQSTLLQRKQKKDEATKPGKDAQMTELYLKKQITYNKLLDEWTAFQQIGKQYALQQKAMQKEMENYTALYQEIIELQHCSEDVDKLCDKCKYCYECDQRINKEILDIC